MKIYLLIRYVCIAALCAFSIIVEAKEITLQHKGLMLNANLELAAEAKLSDGVILITHGGLAHRDMEMIVYLRGLLKDRGYNTLSINLSLALNNRHGMYDCKVVHRHHNDDAVDEIEAWMKWLEKQDVKQVILLGHSRGGAQTALFAAERDNALIKAVVLMAPATDENTNATAYMKRYGEPLAPVLEKAKKLVETGRGDTVLEQVNLLNCLKAPVSAKTFVSYYGQDSRLDTPSLIPKIRKPVFVVVAGDDNVVVGLDKKVASLVDDKQVQMKVIDGSNHLFRDINMDDAVDAITEFLEGL